MKKIYRKIFKKDLNLLQSWMKNQRDIYGYSDYVDNKHAIELKLSGFVQNDEKEYAFNFYCTACKKYHNGEYFVYLTDKNIPKVEKLFIKDDLKFKLLSVIKNARKSI